MSTYSWFVRGKHGAELYCNVLQCGVAKRLIRCGSDSIVVVGDEFAAERIFAAAAVDGKLNDKLLCLFQWTIVGLSAYPLSLILWNERERPIDETVVDICRCRTMAFCHLKVMLIAAMFRSLAFVATSCTFALPRRTIGHLQHLRSSASCSVPKHTIRAFASSYSAGTTSEKQKVFYDMTKQVESISRRIEMNTQQLGSTESIQHRLEDLELMSSEKSFWDDANSSQKVLEIKRLKSLLDTSTTWRRDLEEMKLLLELCESENVDSSPLLKDLEDVCHRTVKSLDEFEVHYLLSDKYDDHNCVLNIQCGLGGQDAQEWVSILYRMYKKLAERRDWRVTVTDESSTDVGLKSIELRIEGSYAYGLLRGEKGTHRLVRISPFNALGKRQTSFAGVETYPELEESESSSIVIPEKVS